MALDEANIQNERIGFIPGATTGLADGDCIAPTVAQVWQSVLLAPVGGPEDDFFAAAAVQTIHKEGITITDTAITKVRQVETWDP